MAIHRTWEKRRQRILARMLPPTHRSHRSLGERATLLRRSAIARANRRPLASFESCGGVLDIFAGKVSLSRHYSSAGLGVHAPIDISFGTHHDMARVASQDYAMSEILFGRFSSVHFGTPSAEWSSARRNMSDTPINREKERNGVGLAVLTCRAVRACVQAGFRWSIENPSSSRRWQYPSTSWPTSRTPLLSGSTCAASGLNTVSKPTLLLTDLAELSSLSRTCCHAHPPHASPEVR